MPNAQDEQPEAGYQPEIEYEYRASNTIYPTEGNIPNSNELVKQPTYVPQTLVLDLDFLTEMTSSVKTTESSSSNSLRSNDSDSLYKTGPKDRRYTEEVKHQPSVSSSVLDFNSLKQLYNSSVVINPQPVNPPIDFGTMRTGLSDFNFMSQNAASNVSLETVAQQFRIVLLVSIFL